MLVQDKFNDNLVLKPSEVDGRFSLVSTDDGLISSGMFAAAFSVLVFAGF